MLMLSFKKLAGLSFVLSAIILFGRFILNTRDYRISGLLKEVVNFLTVLDSTLMRATKLAEEDPYKELIDEIKPAYEKISSIKRQTEIYESMQRIPGGPTNFMSTSLETLESVARQLTDFEKRYRLIVAGKKKEIGLLQEDYKKSLQGLDTVFEDRTLEELERIGIYLNDPPDSLTEEELDIHLDVIREKISNLAKMFETLENLQQKSAENSEDEIDGKIDENLEKEITKFIKEVAGLISRDEHYFRQIMPKIGERWKKIEEAVSKIGEHQSHVKTRYEKLGDQLDTDVTRTRDRINGLKYPKKSDEL